MTSTEALDLAKHLGLHIARWSPGDGVTRYKVFTREQNYFAESGLYTAFGVKELAVWLDGYRAGKESK